MKYNKIGDTDISVSEIGFGAEWMVDKTQDEVNNLIRYCEDVGINIFDCWMSDPSVRSKLGNAIKNTREKWIIQGHIGSTNQNGQYVRTRQMDKVIEAFEDLLTRLQTDYIDFGMIHYVDEVAEYNTIINNEYMDYVRKLKEENTIHHIGLSTHNPKVAILAAENPEIELIMVSSNPAYDMLPSTENIEEIMDFDNYDENLAGLQPDKAQLYQLCKDTKTALTIMKGYAGGSLLNEKDSPFNVALTPVQCLAYLLNIESTVSVMVGVQDVGQMKEAVAYETASDEEKDYGIILSSAPSHSYLGKCIYCGHCAPCPMDINIAMVNKYYDLAKIHDEIPESINQHYNELSKHASDCIECHQCEERCPFNVQIVDYMNKATKLFNI